MTPEEERILAWTLLGEAAGESDLGLLAVAHVIRNRSLSGRFPSNPASVAIQNNGRFYQFSAWNAPGDQGNSPRARYPVGSDQFNRASRVVEKVFGPTPGADPTDGATHYYSPGGMKDGKAPYWWTSEARWGEKTIGGHVFAVRQVPKVTGFPTPVDRRPGQPAAPVQQQVRLPEIAPPPTTKLVYDPVTSGLVPQAPTARQVRTEAPTTRMAQTNRSIVAGFSVPGGLPGMVSVDAAREEKNIPQSNEGTVEGKDQSRLAPGLVRPQSGNGLLTARQEQAAAAGRVSGAPIQVKAPVGLPTPRDQRPTVQGFPTPASQRPAAPVKPDAPTLKVIVQGGNYGLRNEPPSAGAGNEYVRTETGKVVRAGTQYTGSDGYTYKVESDGSITNMKSGSNSSVRYNPDTNQFEGRRR